MSNATKLTPEQRQAVLETIEGLEKADVRYDEDYETYVLYKHECPLCDRYWPENCVMDDDCPLAKHRKGAGTANYLAGCSVVFNEKFERAVLEQDGVHDLESEEQAEECRAWCIATLKALL